MVFQGRAWEPSLESLPVVATKYWLWAVALRAKKRMNKLHEKTLAIQEWGRFTGRPLYCRTGGARRGNFTAASRTFCDGYENGYELPSCQVAVPPLCSSGLYKD